MTDTPLGTPQDVIVSRATSHHEFLHDGKLYKVDQRPMTWHEETQLISRGAYFADYADYWLNNLVVESSIPMTSAKDRMGWTPEFGRTVCRELGIYAAYKRLGLEPTSTSEERKNE